MTVWPSCRLQRLGLGDLEAQAQPPEVDERRQDVADLDELPGVDGARVDLARRAAERTAERRWFCSAISAGGLGGGRVGREALGLLAGAIQLLDGDELLLRERLAPREVRLGPLPVGDRPAVRGLGALGLEPVALRVDPREDGVGRHVVAGVEEDLLDGAARPRR